MSAFRRQVSAGLTVVLDSSLNVVIESDRPVHTVTNVAALCAALEDARTVARVRADNLA